MKATGLQINDWLYRFGDIPFQVECNYNNGYEDVLGEYEEETIDCETGEGDIRKKDITIDMVTPIPLTEEILKANGFLYADDGDGGVFYYNSFELQEREPYNGLSEFGITICKVDRIVNYVHELQHILRDCGLDDLADNFKVE